MSSLLTYAVVYIVESALAFQRGRVLGTLFSHAVFGAAVASLLVGFYPVLLEHTYSGQRGQLGQCDPTIDNKSITIGNFAQKTLLALYYAIVFCIIPLCLSISLCIRCLELPESPRWLLANRTPRDCQDSLERLRGTKEITMEFNIIYRLGWWQ